MAAFADLHVIPRVDDEKSCRRMAELLKLAGYSYVGLTIPSGLLREKITSLKTVFADAGTEVALRVDLSPSSRVELLRLLRRFRNAYDVVAVRCVNPRVATVACRDRRVDIVFFDPVNRMVRFNHPLANLLGGAVEFSLISALLSETREDVLSGVMKQAAIAQEHSVRVVLSSGCRFPEMVRSANQIAALGRTMGLSEKQARAGVSSEPLSIIERNSIRRSPQFVEEGVRLVLPRVG